MDVKLFLIFVLSDIALCVTADSDEFPGICPQIAPVSAFDVEKFGNHKWYLAEETDSDTDRCVTIEINTKPQNTISRTGIENDGDKINETNPFTMASPGILSVKDGDDTDEYVVIATDYDSYAVLYTCENDFKDKTYDEDVYVYVHQNKMTAPDAPFAAAKAAIQGKGIQSNNFQKIDQSNCSDSA